MRYNKGIFLFHQKKKSCLPFSIKKLFVEKIFLGPLKAWQGGRGSKSYFMDGILSSQYVMLHMQVEGHAHWPVGTRVGRRRWGRDVCSVFTQCEAGFTATTRLLQKIEWNVTMINVFWCSQGDGHPTKYWPRATFLNFGDRTRNGVFNVVDVGD